MRRRGAALVTGIVTVLAGLAAVPAATSFAASAVRPATQAIATSTAPAPTALHGWSTTARSVTTGKVLHLDLRVSGGMRTVLLERRLHGRWRLVDRARSTADGTVALTWRAPKHPGRAVLRVAVPRTAGHRAAVSSVHVVTVQTATAAALLRLVNRARATARTCGGTAYPAAPPLAASAALDRAAGGYAALMARRDFFSHDGPDGSTMVTRIGAVGIHGVAMRENIAAGQRSASSVVRAWLASPGHCVNLMATDVRRIGLGAATGGSYGRYWVQDFAG